MLRFAGAVVLALILFGLPCLLVAAAGWLPAPWWAVLAVPFGFVFVPAALILAFRWRNPPLTAFMLGAMRNLRQAAQPARLEHQWVSYGSLPEHLRLAAIAGEDTYFAFHGGFDWTAIRMAREQNWAGEGVRGGSTISQQVAKNLFLWQGPSYLRKAIEAFLTLLIEASWPKWRILEVYLNVAQFGPRTFGVEAAAQRFFGKSASALSAEEAALLVAVLPAPRRFDAGQPSHLVRYRQVMILAGMRKLGNGYLARLEGATPLGPRVTR